MVMAAVVPAVMAPVMPAVVAAVVPAVMPAVGIHVLFRRIGRYLLADHLELIDGDSRRHRSGDREIPENQAEREQRASPLD
jgi:hypothetical protein